jgi:threonine dehydrogenase-like Zn-dependent dehydrogenase
MSLELVCTHLLRYQVAGADAVDALATTRSNSEVAPRFFVPGFLPCGECPLCRRGLVGACPTATRPVAAADASVGPRDGGRGRALVLPDRFVAAVDEPPGAEVLQDEAAILAGVVAFALHAMATASLAPGDFAIWLGAGPVAAAGAALCSARGAHSFWPSAAATSADPSAAAAGAATAAVASVAADVATQLAHLAAAPATAHGSRKRLLFITEPGASAWTDAVALSEPGASFVALGAAGRAVPGSLLLPAEGRVLLLSAYHPDFVPEALAALRRPELAPLRAALTEGPEAAAQAGLRLVRL